jgi:fibronectin type 3 domain-containing protein
MSNAPNSPATLSFSGAGLQPPPVVHSATLSWNASTSTVVGYNVYRSAVSGSGYTLVNSTLIPASSYVDSGVQAGGTYYYVATAVDANNVESAFSAEIPATIP